GRELVLSYEGGLQKVHVADTAAIASIVPGQRSQLVPGSYVSLTAAPESDGRLTARSIEVRNDAAHVAGRRQRASPACHNRSCNADVRARRRSTARLNADSSPQISTPLM